MDRYGYTDWEPESEGTADGSGDPHKFFAFIREDGEEFLMVVHRASERYPIDGSLAKSKLARLEQVTNILNKEN